jgi:ABC-type nitrate/sulfonate/bicarbonate transport system substrate-binding protein
LTGLRVHHNELREFSVSPVSEQDLDELMKARCWLNERALRESIAHGDSAWTVAVLATSKGIDPNSIKRVSVGGTGARVAALKTKDADATVIDLGIALKLQAKGEVKILSGFDEAVKNFQNQCLWASHAAIKDKANAVRAFVQGWYKTIAFAKTHKPEMVAFWQKTLNVDQDIASQLYDRLVKSNFFSTDGKIEPATLKHMAEDFAAAKRLPKVVDLSQYVTDQFLPKQ